MINQVEVDIYIVFACENLRFENEHKAKLIINAVCVYQLRLKLE